MYNLLIVDDEPYVLEDLSQSINWKAQGVGAVWTAMAIHQALEILQREEIHILMCDIELPQGNGLEIIAWVRENKPDIECIVITSHADFNYAQKAVRLGTLDYFVKPVKYGEVERSVSRAAERLDKLSRTREAMHFDRLWHENEKLIKETFWKEIIERSIPSDMESVKRIARRRHIELYPGYRLLPILFRVVRWYTKTTRADQRLFEYGLRNIAEESFAALNIEGIAIDLPASKLCYLLRLPPELLDRTGAGLQAGFADLINDRIEAYLKIASQSLDVELDAIVGRPTHSPRLADMLEDMADTLTGRMVESRHAGQTDSSDMAAELSDQEHSVIAVVEYVNAHLDGELDRESLAELVNFSPDHLDRLFKKQKGCTVYQFILTQRLKKAQELLSMTRLSVADIAAQVGYQNAASFAIAFKKMNGTSASEFRRRHNG